ncbi:MAG: zinc-ribbon domain-containing protein [Thermoplasmata archaeon]
MYSYNQNPQDVAISEITSNISLSKILLIVIMAIVGLYAIWDLYLILFYGGLFTYLSFNIGLAVVAIIIQLFLLNKINEAENYAKMRNLLPLNNLLNDMTVIVLSFIFGAIIVGLLLYLAKEKVNSLVQMPQGSMQQYPPVYPQPQYAPGAGAIPYPQQYPPAAMPSQPIVPPSMYPPQYPQQPATIYCQSCGKPIPSNSTRCPYCGYPVSKM